ncbi:sodium- and chloride-dependent taurine transporter-like [Physella acuta]|uniref:sodium- and chloride-dependent taurine transporter-like n=1 Tax=Physella acuta TaxID=109671 RepID=UPI0027DBB39B|nr:sodium- and chloride-dependent taurine transporter-like [Physella acuta]
MDDAHQVEEPGIGRRKPKLRRRQVWAKKLDFLVACIGFSVGLANVWRFPFLCYRNGGGAFLVPYFISVILGGIPMFFLEVSLGQFMSEGGIGCWKIVPLFKGIGYATAAIIFLVNCEYNIILSWAFYYVFASFTTTLPWSHCGNAWNTPNCSMFDDPTLNFNNTENLLNTALRDVLKSPINDSNTISLDLYSDVTEIQDNGRVKMFQLRQKAMSSDPVTEFWERKVLGLSSGVGEPGTIKWDNALCLLLAWVIVYVCICKGIKSSGKVMYFTVSSPYVFMFILLVRGVTLEGSTQGLLYYLDPKWERLADAQVWVDAGTQIFFSYAISLGTLMALGSYNKFHHNCFRDSLIFALVNSLTSLLAGVVIFSILGYMAFKQNISIEDVAEAGPGLIFIAYPEAVSQMPLAPFWSACFFIMIILLGLDSQFAAVEGFISACVDLCPDILRRGYRKEIFTVVVCVVSYIIGLSMVTEGGMYVFQLFDYYSASRIVMLVAVVECLVVAYVYGIDRFCDNLIIMFGFNNTLVTKLLRWYIRIFNGFLSPFYTLAIFTLGCASYSEVDYKRKFVTYVFPSWAIGIGWTLALVSVALIPVFMIQGLVVTPGTLIERLRILTTPRLKEHQLRPNEDLSKIILEENQSSQVSTSPPDWGRPALGNNGIRVQNLANYDCTHTQSEYASWWLVDFQGWYLVNHIIFSNRYTTNVLNFCELEAMSTYMDPMEAHYTSYDDTVLSLSPIVTITTETPTFCALDCLRARDTRICLAFNWFQSTGLCQLLDFNPSNTSLVGNLFGQVGARLYVVQPIKIFG